MNGDEVLAELRWRTMIAADLPAVVEIAETVFPHHFEDPAFFAERLALAPQWCFALTAAGGALQGYLIAYPWPLGAIPPLNAPLGSLPASRALFLHDIALRPSVGGAGHARSGIELLARRAADAGVTDIALVAVNDTVAFWSRQGFLIETAPAMEAKAASYGVGARYLRRRLA